jgi:hypothetical protein
MLAVVRGVYAWLYCKERSSEAEVPLYPTNALRAQAGTAPQIQATILPRLARPTKCQFNLCDNKPITSQPISPNLNPLVHTNQNVFLRANVRFLNSQWSTFTDFP